MKLKTFESFNRNWKEDVEYYFITNIADHWVLSELDWQEFEEQYELIMNKEDVDNYYCIEKSDDGSRVNIQLIKKTSYLIDGREEENVLNEFETKCKSMGLDTYKHIYQYLIGEKKLRPYLYVRFSITL
jgi:hypothetical protein